MIITGFRFASVGNGPKYPGDSGVHCEGVRLHAKKKARIVISENYEHLIVGRLYVVTKEFEDYDGILHAAGETWTYLGYSYFFYDAGLTLFIVPGDSIRLQDAELFQHHIVSELETYINPVE